MSRNLGQKIAEVVMGWKLMNSETYNIAKGRKDYDSASRDDGWFWEGWEDHEAWQWNPIIKVEHDYEVLKHVREKWSRDQILKFDEELGDILGCRAGMHREWHLAKTRYYEPGDYSKAALKALGEEI